MYEYMFIGGIAAERTIPQINIEANDGWRVRQMVLGNDGNPLILLERAKKQK